MCYPPLAITLGHMLMVFPLTMRCSSEDSKTRRRWILFAVACCFIIIKVMGFMFAAFRVITLILRIKKAR